MRKRKTYNHVVFSATAIEAALREFKDAVDDNTETKYQDLIISRDNETWDYDTLEEFLADFRAGFQEAEFSVRNPSLYLSIRVCHDLRYSIRSNITIDAKDRSKIQRINNVFDSYSEGCQIPEPEIKKPPPPKPKIFIGHGQSPLWRDLKDHLADHHGFEVVSYESGARAGHTIRDVISELLDKSSFAILIMTGDDEMPDGSLRARQNVIHEIGLFQGRLGFTKAIVIKEEGTEEFSNINGVQQIRFSRGNIKETFGDVLATLRREFGKRAR